MDTVREKYSKKPADTGSLKNRTLVAQEFANELHEIKKAVTQQRELSAGEQAGYEYRIFTSHTSNRP